ncbi:DUF721 domain-containing protein [Geminicoccus harenae]|uniref:DUF721 domain-containing protein n=1 Tax=Geminicoccus harenae TaxID=2498453 RepID=UPI001C98B0B7|nr:DciA family protein [Geminicoccus harenae]
MPGMSSGAVVRVTRSQRLGEFVEAVIAPAARRRGLAATTLIRDWPLVVGERLAARCQPVRVSFAPGRQSGGTLVLHAAASAALDLQFSERQVVERVNAHYGYPAVARLRIVQAPLLRPPPPRRRRPARPDDAELARLSGATAEVADPELAAALLRLGCAIAVADRSGAGGTGK